MTTPPPHPQKPGRAEVRSRVIASLIVLTSIALVLLVVL